VAERPLRHGLQGSFLHPHSWPLRWRLTAVLAGTTCIILAGFALVVGRLASNRLHSDFENDLMSSARAVAAQIPASKVPGFHVRLPEDFSTAIIRVVYYNGRLVDPGAASPHRAPSLGRPVPGVTEHGNYDVATVRVPPASIPTGFPSLAEFVQYARSTDSVDATIGRLWLFLITGAVSGTIIAALAGYFLAGRTLRPISTLTAAARRIGATRDPSFRIPEPEAEDEVAELARTLDKMLRELDAARAETNQMVQAQRDFVADASHELRTPLTSILANLELLQARLEEAAYDPESEEALEGALASSRRMRRLVSDLLLLARADAGRIATRRECDLTEIAAAAMGEVGALVGGHKLRYEADGAVPVEGNPDELHRMVANLLENGVRHTPAGTEIHVSVSRAGGEAVLEVADDGPGLPEELGDQLFKRFVRGSGPADTSADGGAGLGLAIVKAVATAHGGDVEAGRSSSGGARFIVALPLLREPGGDSCDEGPKPNGGARSAEPAGAS
jgi:two-component system, OmpR family, sensor kinase